MLVSLSAFLGTTHIRRDLTMTGSSPIEASAHVHELLRKLHALSLEQEERVLESDTYLKSRSTSSCKTS